MMQNSKKDTGEELLRLVRSIYNTLKSGEVPEIVMSSRNRDNIVLDPKFAVWRYGENTVTRSAKFVDGAEYMLKALYMIEFILEMIRGNKTSTLREMYYISEGWKSGKFGTQDESDVMAEDLEVITALMREDLRLRPEENGASVIGDLTIEEKNRKGEFKKINCNNDVGEAGYNIPYNADQEKLHLLSANADRVLAIETGGMFDRLVENGYDETSRTILVHLKGQPARSTRRLLKRLNEELHLPIYVFTDGDPWSFRIFASVAYGAIKTAHIPLHLADATAQHIGIPATHIQKYDLPTDKLTDKDIQALQSELKDPRFSTDFWNQEINAMLQMNKKAEQQALAKYGLDFVTDTYLPDKFADVSNLGDDL